MDKRPRPFSTSIAKKILMALTGLALCLFLVTHLAGNLVLLMGFEKFNAYSHFLVSLPFIIPLELGLAALLLIHAYEAVVVTLQNKKSRPQEYAYKTWARNKSDRSRKTLASTTMMISGTLILIFVIFHVWHFKFDHPVGGAVVGVGTTGVATTEVATTEKASSGAEEVRNLAALVVGEFRKPWIVALYVLSMGVLGLHLYHAVASSFQTLGVDHPGFRRVIFVFGKIFTIVIAGGFALLPLWVYFFVR